MMTTPASKNKTKVKAGKGKKGDAGARCAKARGGNFSQQETECMLDLVEELKPLSLAEWNVVAERHIKYFPDCLQDGDSLRRKFNTLYKKKPGTGNPHIPWDAKREKEVKEVLKAASGLMTGSPDKL